MRRWICILTAVAMVFTMSGLGVFAAEGVEDQSADPAVNAENAVEPEAAEENGDVQLQESEGQADQQIGIQSEPAVNGEEVQLQQKAQHQDPPAPLTNVRIVSGFHSLKVAWDASAGADAYNVGRWNDDLNKWESAGVVRETSVEKNAAMYKQYKFRVMAVKLKEESKNKEKLDWTDIDGTTSGGVWTGAVTEPVYVNGGCVDKMRIYITLKKGKKYGGVKYKAGSRVASDSYGGGRYYFTNSKGKRASVSRIATRKAKADYKKNGDYGLESATYFINSYMNDNKKLKPKNGRVIWVSTYMQHLYMFKLEGGKWVPLNNYNWKVSMGKASTPSPTGNKILHKKISSRHGIRYWNCFSGLNALHGVKGNWGKKLGRLASHGCIRNPKDGAKKIWNNCSKGTRVIVY